jgi:hypothetical protein
MSKMIKIDRRKSSRFLARWFFYPVFLWLGAVRLDSKHVNICFENTAGEVERFGHAFPGYFLPFLKKFLDSGTSFAHKTLVLQPLPGGSLSPIRGFKSKPKILADLLEDIFPDLSFRYTGRAWGAKMIRVPGGRRYHPAYWLEKELDYLNAIQ